MSVDLAKVLTTVPVCSDCKHSVNRVDCQSPELTALSLVFDGKTYAGAMVAQRECRWNPSLCSLAGYWFEAR